MAWTTRPLTPSEASIIHHPDRRTPWAPSVIVTVAGDGLDAALVRERLAALVAAHPILDARVDGDAWVARSGALALESMGPELDLLRARFDLRTGPPLRVALSPDGRRLGIVVHHAALDGRALVLIARALLGGESPAPLVPGGPAAATPAGAAGAAGAARAADPAPAARATDPALAVEPTNPAGGRGPLARLMRPADRVAPSPTPPSGETFVSAAVPEQVRLRVAPLAAAAVAASGERNRAAGAPWRRVGLTIPVGGPDVLGNVSTHRRIDLPATADVVAAVTAALAQAVPPAEDGHSPALMRLLGPVVNRFSDSLLVSNLGLVTIPGAAAVDFYPQARGRSAVALGACTVEGGERRLTLRARDITESDAQRLLDQVIARLA